MKKIFEDDNIVIYSKSVSDSLEVEVVTTDGMKRALPVPSLFELGFGIGKSLCFINPNTGEELCGGDGEIMLISNKSNKVLYNDQVWSIKGLAIHLQGKYSDAKCSDATPYDFFSGDEEKNLCERSLMDLYNDFFEKKYGIKIQRSRFRKILEKNYEKNKKDTVMIDDILKNNDDLTLASEYDWTGVKYCEWSLIGTKFFGKVDSFKDMFKQVVIALHNLKPNVLDNFVMDMLAENDMLLKVSTREIFDASGKPVIVNGVLNGVEISSTPFNYRNIETYSDNMWIEIVPNWIYVWGLYNNNGLVGIMKKVFEIFDFDANSLRLTIGKKKVNKPVQLDVL